MIDAHEARIARLVPLTIVIPAFDEAIEHEPCIALGGVVPIMGERVLAVRTHSEDTDADLWWVSFERAP